MSLSPAQQRGLLAAAAGSALFAVFLLPSAPAQPPGPAVFCDVYPQAPACAAGDVSCATCHTAPPSLNLYGAEVSAHLDPERPRPLHADAFSDGLPQALAAVEALDSDVDGFSNLQEITGGSSPADANSTPVATDCLDSADDGYDLCGYDPQYAYKKLMIDFCGRSPTLYERESFAKAKEPSAALHEQLDVCLDSEHWRGIRGRVWNLANRKIGPTQAVKAGKEAGPIPLADYNDDYAYFVWTQTDGRDVRLVLTGQTFVSARYEGGVTTYTEWDRTPYDDYEARGYDSYQAVEKSRRAGMLTHRWFLMVNTMFTSVPRTTAAQAYRAYLGYDIARLEGLYDVDSEPVDYDSKGVAADGCRDCHATLDPLTYPFSRYHGIGGGSSDGDEQYAYDADRMPKFVGVDGADVANVPEQGMLLGQPVADLVEWGQVAANSDAFRRATVRDYWKMLLREEPRPNEQAEFGALVDGLGTTHGWSIEAMLHELIDTEAYGAP